MIENYQKSLGKSKSEMEHQKICGKLSEFDVLTMETVSAAFCVAIEHYFLQDKTKLYQYHYIYNISL